VDAAWPGSRADEVRMLPDVLPAAQLAELSPAGHGTEIAIGIDETTLSPVTLDFFAADPHFLVFGDVECGKSNLLRLVADGITARYRPEAARLIVIDYRRSLLDAADTAHRIGYAASSSAATSLLTDAREALQERLPTAGLTADELRARSWWKGSDLFLIVDDYDLVAGATNPLLPLLDLLPQARDIGLHVVLARSAGGAGRAMFEPVVQRLREMGTPTLLMSASKDEGQLFGIKPQPLPPGRGHLIARRSASRLVQTALAGDLPVSGGRPGASAAAGPG
jgi:S-DNA-T family DNA segregation ATPase FtsK/SpoIIIE